LVIGIMLFARTLRISLLFLCAAGMSLPQDPLAALNGALPLTVGDRWIYDTEIRDGVDTHIEVQHWVQQDTTMAVEWIPEGVLIRRKVSVQQPAVLSSSIRIPEESNILVRGSCIYYLQDFYRWDSKLHDLDVAFRTALNHGEGLPDACFPLRQGHVERSEPARAGVDGCRQRTQEPRRSGLRSRTILAVRIQPGFRR